MMDKKPRERYEEVEAHILAPEAVISAETRGRKRDERSCPVRTEFQRDRDRIVHSKAFRRLKHKTQVFIDPEDDHYRTRLTHTFEVTQIARTISRALRLNEDLTEAIGLGHDLGHTPFGHAGERAIDAIIKYHYPEESFRHYEQSLRVVDVLERKGRGLNLTWEVRDGILNHSKGKANLSSGGGAATLEGNVVRISDRIAYINHDIDDSVRDGIISESDLPREAIDVLGNSHSSRIDTMVLDIISSSSDMQEVRMSDEVREATDVLKNYLFANVYELHERSLNEIKGSQELVMELFDYYLKHPEEIPAMVIDETGVTEIAYPLGDDDQHSVLQKVVDFVSGMTDRYAQNTHSKIFGKVMK